MVVATTLQKLFCSMLTNYTFYIQFVAGILKLRTYSSIYVLQNRCSADFSKSYKKDLWKRLPQYLVPSFTLTGSNCIENYILHGNFNSKLIKGSRFQKENQFLENHCYSSSLLNPLFKQLEASRIPIFIHNAS